TYPPLDDCQLYETLSSTFPILWSYVHLHGILIMALIIYSLGTDKSKIIRKQSKTSKHGHENLKSTKRSHRTKAEARKVKPQSNHGQQKSTKSKNISSPLNGP
ncbi:hypothetical protein Tco_0055901, partial [Tanacetum coccineum]